MNKRQRKKQIKKRWKEFSEDPFKEMLRLDYLWKKACVSPYYVCKIG
jgi:hypothetical protein